jgi:sugar/nucleoside kinase (ribokinase family)
LLLYEKQLFQHPGFKVEAVDTVGAGDAFLAGLIAKLSEGKLPEKALEFACATGAFVASRKRRCSGLYSRRYQGIFITGACTLYFLSL